MPIVIKVEYEDEEPPQDLMMQLGPITFKELHRMRRLVIDAAIMYLITYKDKTREEIRVQSEEIDRMDEDGKDTSNDKIGYDNRQTVYRHLRAALEDLKMNWLLDDTTKATAKLLPGEDNEMELKIQTAQERVAASPCDIDYENIPGYLDDKKDVKKWTKFLDMAGLVWFVSLPERDCSLTPGQAFDINKCFQTLESYMKKVADANPNAAEQANATFQNLLGFKSLCKSVIELYVKQRQYTSIVFRELKLPGK